MPNRPLTVKELIKKLKPYGVRALTDRGKGSETILVRPDPPNSKKGPQFPIKNHGKGTEIYIPVIKALLRRFNIAEKEFWGE